MQSDQTFIQKRFTITNELSSATVSLNINVPYIPDSREINMSRALTEIHTNGVNLLNSHIFYLDFQKKMHVYIGQYPFHQEVVLKYDLFLQNQIQVRYRKISNQSAMEVQSCPSIPKKKKVKERTIKTAIDAVKLWRELYQTTDQKGRRIYTLQSAAQKVGLAKKTLDDYYNQLRHAKYFGFDFVRHQNDKIGVLRKFVKNAINQQQFLASMEMMNQEQACGNSSTNFKQIDEIDKYFQSSPSSEDEDY